MGFMVSCIIDVARVAVHLKGMPSTVYGRWLDNWAVIISLLMPVPRSTKKSLSCAEPVG